MKTVAVIIAGGRSSRMGREKSFETVAGETILARIIASLQPQVNDMAINANGDTGRFEACRLPIIGDLRSDVGTPLAGLHAALDFAEREGFDALLTVPSDCPFLPDDLLRRLAEPQARAALAASGGQAHFVTGLWRPVLLPLLTRALDERPPPRLQDWAKRAGAVTVEWPLHPHDPFFNVNTPEELAEAGRIAARCRA